MAKNNDRVSRDIAAELRVIVSDHMAPGAPLARALLLIADHIEQMTQQPVITRAPEVVEITPRGIRVPGREAS
jgi:hypothetical protein